MKKTPINTNKVFCPKCGEEQPFLRIPNDRAQLIKGGWDCKKCGCKMDNLGKEVENDDDKKAIQ